MGEINGAVVSGWGSEIDVVGLIQVRNLAVCGIVIRPRRVVCGGDDLDLGLNRGRFVVRDREGEGNLWDIGGVVGVVGVVVEGFVIGLVFLFGFLRRNMMGWGLYHKI